MMGRRVLPPAAGSPMRRRCSSTILERRLASRLGRQGTGSTIASTLPEVDTASRPNPSSRHSFLTRGSLSRPRARREARTANQISSQAAERSTACRTRSRVKVSFSSPITTAVGEPRSRATRSQPQTSPLTSKPKFSRKRLTGRYRLDSNWPSLDAALSMIRSHVEQVRRPNSHERQAGLDHRRHKRHRPGWRRSVSEARRPCRHRRPQRDAHQDCCGTGQGRRRKASNRRHIDRRSVLIVGRAQTGKRSAHPLSQAGRTREQRWRDVHGATADRGRHRAHMGHQSPSPDISPYLVASAGQISASGCSAISCPDHGGPTDADRL